MGLLSDITRGVGNVLGIGESATKYARKAGEVDLAFKQKGLDYLKSAIDPRLETEQQARQALMGFYGLGGGQQDFISEVQKSPFYQSMLEQGRQGVGAGLSATGQLRGGLAPETFYQQDQQVLQDLVNQRLSGLTGLAQPTSVTPIAQMYSGMGESAAAQQQAIGQAKQDKYGNMLSIGSKIIGSFF
jgi:hypothetical protein